MTRDDRQKLSCQRWVKAGGAASIVASTGYGLIICKSINYADWRRNFSILSGKIEESPEMDNIELTN